MHNLLTKLENDLDRPDMLSYYSEVDEPKEECKRYDYTTRGRFQWLVVWYRVSWCQIDQYGNIQ